MAIDTANYSCDMCDTAKLEYSQVNSIHLEGFLHGKDGLCSRDSLGHLHLCHECYSSLKHKGKKTLFRKVKDILCRITT